MQDRVELVKLEEASEEALGDSAITDWLSPEFFETRFWQHWLRQQGVQVMLDCRVDDLALSDADDATTVTAIHFKQGGAAGVIEVRPQDLVFFQNGSMTNASNYCSMRSAPAGLTKRDSQGWALWEKLAAGRPRFGNPAAFNSSIPESWWESFTVTLKDPALFGNFVAKPMAECSGEEILRELCGHLNFDYDEVMATANCIPCRMPYITSMFMPRRYSDRPLPVPEGSRNLAFVSQFVEVPEDVVFTVEYSVRAAQMAVYQLLNVQRAVPRVTPHDESLKVKLEALVKAFK